MSWNSAATEADEFQDIYNLEVLEIPTNMPMVRIDDDDEVSHGGGEIPCHHHADRGLQETRPAGAGRHDVNREIGSARRVAAPAGLGAARLLRSERVCRALFRR